MNVLQGLAFGLMCLLVPVWFFLMKRLVQRLELLHEARYASMDLGGLGLFEFHRSVDEEDRSSAALSRLLGFLWRGDHHRVADQEVARLGSRMRLVAMVSAGLFLLFASTVFLGVGPAPDQRGQPVASGAGSQSVDRDQAFRLYRAGKLGEAIVVFDALLARPGRDAEALFWRAMAFVQRGDDDRALQDLQRLQEWEPAHFEAHLQADRILTRARRWDDILAQWDRFLALEPHHAQAYFERAGAHFHKGDKPAALADAQRACDLGRVDACRRAKQLQAGP